MASRPKTGAQIARPDTVTRRGLVAGAPATALFASSTSAGAPDQAVTACENWLALDAEHNRLSRRWQKLETQLALEHNFLKLSRRQQRKLPQAQELYEIDDLLEEVWEEQEALFKILSTLVATSAFGLAGKLAVAARHICKDENEAGHHLIASILRDLRAMMSEDGP